MRVPFKLIIVGMFVIAALLLTLVFTHKREVVAETPVQEAPSDNTVTKYIEKVELENELERDEKQEAYLHEKQAKAKKESVECQFWTKQQASHASRKNADKVTQFCELSTESSSASAAAEIQSAQKTP